MAIFTANSSGNLSAAGTWDSQVAANDFNTASTVALSTGGAFTAVFTAPNTTNAATGVWVSIGTVPSVNITATLYESGIATAAVATIVYTNIPTGGGMVYFRLPTPYVFTTTGAGAYKWSIASVGSNSGTVYYSGTVGVVGSLTTEDITGTPGVSDQILIGAHNCTTAVTVTVDGTSGDVEGGVMVFTAATYTAKDGFRPSIFIGGSATKSSAILKWDTSASATLKSDSMMIGYGGEMQIGTVATPYPSSYVATYDSVSAASGGNGIMVLSGGRLILQGNPLTYYKTSYVSGAGTAASPLIVSDSVDWSVNDRIYVTGTSANATNYNETETRFIKTKNSATSYVLSTTAGGAEAALTFTHDTNAVVINYQRNIILTPSTNLGFQLQMNCAAAGDINIDWTEIKYLGKLTGTPDTPTIFSAQYVEGGQINGEAAIDYSVFNLTNGFGLCIFNTVATAYTNNIFSGSTNPISSTFLYAQLLIPASSSNLTFTDCYFLNNTKLAILYNGASNCNFTRITCCGNAKTSQSYVTGAFYLAGSSATITDSNFHANRPADIVAANSAFITFTDCEISTKGASAIGVYIKDYTSNQMLFNSCNVSATSTVSNYIAGAVGGTLIAFDTLNGTTNNHKWYTEYGSAQSTGSGLSDTNVRTSNTLNVRLSAENSSIGFKYEYQILAVPSRAVFALGFIQRNAAFASDTCIVELFLPDSTVADASQTMATTVGTYLPFSIAATYNGSISRYATVRISARTTTSAAYVYIADLFNGTNNITNFNTWSDGQPSSIMFEQLGDAAAVWAVPISTMTTAGTIGNFVVKKLLTIAKFIGLK